MNTYPPSSIYIPALRIRNTSGYIYIKVPHAPHNIDLYSAIQYNVFFPGFICNLLKNIGL